jgi:microcystin-dependent protein
VLQINSDQIIHRGMIVMHSGITPIPEGWAICDGNEYTYNGITSITPNLIGRFIKATNNKDDIKNIDNYPDNNLTLTTDYLPKHSHPHLAHSHSFSGSTSINNI